MSEQTPRDLVPQLRGVDDAFAGLKPSKDEALDALLDEDRVARGARRGTGASVFVGAAAAVVVAVVIALTSTSSSAPDATTSTTTPIATTTVPTPTPTPTLPATTTTTPQTAEPAPLKLVRVPVEKPRSLVRGDHEDAALVAVPDNGGVGDGANVAPSAAHVDVVGVGGASDVGVSDDDVETALEEVRVYSRRGQFAAAAAVLERLLQQRPAPRVQDTLGYERALLLTRAHDDVGACAALREHSARFPKSENASDVVTRLSRCP